MNCFKICIYNSKEKPNCNYKSSRHVVNKINSILIKHRRTKLKATDQTTISSLLLEKILNHKNASVHPLDTYNLVSELLATKYINVNEIKNFLNQTLLHFTCENNDKKLCELLLRHGGDCLLEDNYRTSPFIITAKRNFKDLNSLFVNSLLNRFVDYSLSHVYWTQIRRTAYYSICAGHLEIAKHLFKSFNLHSEQICMDERDNGDISRLKLSELNPLHVAAYKANLPIVEFLFKNTQETSQELFKNMPLNEFRDCTALEEAFKGLLMLDSNPSSQHSFILEHFRQTSILNSERNKKRLEHLKIVNLLIEKGCRFSANFVETNGLSKMLVQIFSGGIRKDSEFVQFLYSCNFLFKFKLDEIFKGVHLKLESSLKNSASPVKLLEFNLRLMIEDFLLKVYWACLKVIKDFKGICLNYLVEILLSLHLSGQLFLNVSFLSFLKEKNYEVFFNARYRG